jgi:hypothetical protein
VLLLFCAAAALAEENALAATLQVAAAYDELMLAHKKEVHCNIITAEVSCSKKLLLLRIELSTLLCCRCSNLEVSSSKGTDAVSWCCCMSRHSCYLNYKQQVTTTL